MSGWSFFRAILFLYGRGWILAEVLIALVGMVSGFLIDIRGFILGLMVIFLVAPLSVFFLYFYEGLRPRCFMNFLRHRVLVKCESIELITYATSGDLDENGEEGLEELRRYRIGYDELGRYWVFKKCIIFPLFGDGKGFLWMPVDGEAGEEGERKEFEEIISRMQELRR